MPFYHSLGKIPHKRHTQFRNKKGELYKEELMGTEGFSGIQSLLYHLHEPTRIISSDRIDLPALKLLKDINLAPRHLNSFNLETSGDPISARVWLLANDSVKIGIATPNKTMKYFYRNGAADELLFVHSGQGFLHSQFGTLPYQMGDYIIVPVGTTYQLECTKKSRFLVVEANGAIEVPKRYRNEYGQFNEFSPFCERDILVPKKLETIDRRGKFPIRIKMKEGYHEIIVDHHPFDVVGWDGYLYPWIFNICDFEPITGRIHQPPPVHQTFSGPGFVVCSFVPRLYDYHPFSIPVPYNHSNVNSDEMIYYVGKEFMSRKGIAEGSITHHPAGIPHGPHPGTVEAALNKKETKELAVMVDTFSPLWLTESAVDCEDPQYVQSWLK